MKSIWFATHPPTEIRDVTPEGTRYDTVVAGAGLTGLAVAALLARSGQRVGVIEARHVGAVTTGHTTGKVSLLQGSVLSQVRRRHGDAVLQAYVDGNREGAAWLLRLLDDREVRYETRPAFTWASTPKTIQDLADELDAAQVAGLEARWAEGTELPFGVAAAITLADQAQIHPLRVLDVLVQELAEHGAVIHQSTRLIDVDNDAKLTLTTSRGHVVADRLVLATGTPVLDRGGHFAKVVPLRSYAATVRLPDEAAVPHGMYLSIDEPTRSLRSVQVDGENLLMVGGYGHVVGRSDSPAAAIEGLLNWTRQHFPGAETTHVWAAQDYRFFDDVPHVGPLPGSGDRIYVATGYNKWGMSNAITAALNLSGQILGGSMDWARQLTGRSLDPGAVAGAAVDNLGVAWELGKGLVRGELRSLPDEPPAEGEGHVGRGPGATPVAVSTVEARTCAVSALCTHMGGVLRWNDAERSWDCPLHGSRFTPQGEVLEGPAVEPLKPVERA